ncbi:MAG: hypothetical protein EP332_06400 [Bacteroidetes bacterium]|nr:MAG: hypothetical protein EP332_06400 [Bacteroidota bacterium]
MKKSAVIGIIAGAGILTAATIALKQKADDASTNLQFIPVGFRVHGIVNGYFLRVVGRMRIVNNSSLTMPITNINFNVQAKSTDSDSYSQIAFIPQVIQQLNLQAGQSFEKEIQIDINLLTAASPIIALLQGTAVKLKLITSMYVLGVLRTEDSSEVSLEMPAAVRKALSFIPGLGCACKSLKGSTRNEALITGIEYPIPFNAQNNIIL